MWNRPAHQVGNRSRVVMMVLELTTPAGSARPANDEGFANAAFIKVALAGTQSAVPPSSVFRASLGVRYRNRRDQGIWLTPKASMPCTNRRFVCQIVEFAQKQLPVGSLVMWSKSFSGRARYTANACRCRARGHKGSPRPRGSDKGAASVAGSSDTSKRIQTCRRSRPRLLHRYICRRCHSIEQSVPVTLERTSD